MTKHATTIEQVSSKLDQTGAHLGDVVWLSMSGVDVKRADIRAAFVSEGLPEALAPEDPSQEAAFGMAVNAYGNGAERGIFLRRADTKRKGSDVLLLRTVKSAGGLDQVETVGRVGVTQTGIAVTKDPSLWSADADGALFEIEAAYNARMERATSSELGSAVVAALLGWCGGIRLRERGNVYWAHAAGAQEVRALAKVLAQFGGSYLAVLPVHDNTEARGAVQRAAAESFESELRDIAAELEAFAGRDGLRASTLEHRLERYEDVRNRVDLYADVLSSKRDDLLAKLEAAKAELRKLLTEQDGKEAA
jgi:hypothetical protein